MLSAMTDISPFFVNKGYHSSLQFQTAYELMSQPAKKFVTDLENTHAELKQTITEAQARYQTPADN